MSGDRVPPFRERPPWLGADLQTLRNLFCGGPPDLSGGERLLLPMPDGDRLAARLDRPAAPLVVLVHGLAGSEASRHGVATTRYLVDQGWPVLRLNLRGSLPSRPTSAGRYHAGKTEDLAEALRLLPTDLTRRGIVLLGHSLGGNLVLKFMGEGGHGLPVLAAVAVSAPIDLAATWRSIDELRLADDRPALSADSRSCPARRGSPEVEWHILSLRLRGIRRPRDWRSPRRHENRCARPCRDTAPRPASAPPPIRRRCERCRGAGRSVPDRRIG